MQCAGPCHVPCRHHDGITGHSMLHDRLSALVALCSFSSLVSKAQPWHRLLMSVVGGYTAGIGLQEGRHWPLLRTQDAIQSLSAHLCVALVPSRSPSCTTSNSLRQQSAAVVKGMETCGVSSWSQLELGVHSLGRRPLCNQASMRTTRLAQHPVGWLNLHRPGCLLQMDGIPFSPHTGRTECFERWRG